MTTTETPSSFRCEHCGEPLKPMRVTFGGNTYHMGHLDCECPGATAERRAREQRTLAEEREVQLRRLMQRYEEAGIPKRYLKAIHEKAEALEGSSLYIHGTQGSGKTHLAMAIAKRNIANGKDVRVEIAPHLVEALRSRKTEDRIISAKLATCDLLVLDDLGKESPTPYACERLFDIVNDRYNADLPIIVTSNYDLNAISKRLSEGDTGRSIASRLKEMCQRIHMDGKDRRLHG